jgi:hypothetical protein
MSPAAFARIIAKPAPKPRIRVKVSLRTGAMTFDVKPGDFIEVTPCRS